MSTRFDRLSDILTVKNGDSISIKDRFELFTGSDVGNTPQKGIHWLGQPPKYVHVMIRCETNSGYEDRWIDEDAGLFLYYLMIPNRGSIGTTINYHSKENLALLNQKEHGAPILLMIDRGEKSDLLDIQGRFELVTRCHDNPLHPGVDSVLLKRIIY
jgi:putative restriction endonuclease